MDFSLDLQNMLQNFLQFLPKLITALLTFVIVLLLSKYAQKTTRKMAEKRIQNNETVKLLSRVSRWTILVFGTVIALEQVDFNITGFVAGLGIAGFTVGFALQDIARNFIAGILLLIRQPFSIGDAVELSGFKGTVVDIAIRDTSVKTFDGELVILPNADVLSKPIKNFTGLKKRRRSIKIGLGYEQDMTTARQKFLAAINAVPGVESEPASKIIATELGDSALILTAYFWVDQTQNDLFAVHSDVVQAIKETADRENINLPYPIQTVRVDKAG